MEEDEEVDSVDLVAREVNDTSKRSLRDRNIAYRQMEDNLMARFIVYEQSGGNPDIPDCDETVPWNPDGTRVSVWHCFVFLL